jgi:hypothetical protein
MSRHAPEIALMQTTPASFDSHPWATWPLRPQGRDEAAARTLRLLRAAWAAGHEPEPWLGFPQHGSNVGFGVRRAPLPIGALRRLWSGAFPFVQPCPACGGTAYLVGAGGHPSVGGLDLVCATCSGRFHQPVGGLARVAQVLNEGALAGTAFEATGPQPGADDGQRLAQALGVALDPPRPLAGEA